MASSFYHNLEFSPLDLMIDEYFNSFNSVCNEILDEIAPLKYRELKTQSQPWMNNEIHTSRQICRKAEQKWKKDRLLVLFVILREFLANFQSTVKAAKTKYFSNIINKNSKKLNILFNMINKVISFAPNHLEANQKMCEDFLQFFVNKVDNLQEQIISVQTISSQLIHLSSFSSFYSSTYFFITVGTSVAHQWHTCLIQFLLSC